MFCAKLIQLLMWLEAPKLLDGKVGPPLLSIFTPGPRLRGAWCIIMVTTDSPAGLVTSALLLGGRYERAYLWLYKVLGNDCSQKVSPGA